MGEPPPCTYSLKKKTSTALVDPLQSFNQSRNLRKGDRVTFYNDKQHRWTVATLISNQIKYYKKIGPCYNFIADDGSKGSHYFHGNGLWSLLSDDPYQASPPSSDNLLSEPDTLSSCSSSPFIDDDYGDQMDISMTPPLHVEHALEYPSAASFPDLDLGIPVRIQPRTWLRSTSEPDMSFNTCQQGLQHRWKRWTSALRAYSLNSLIHSSNHDGLY